MGKIVRMGVVGGGFGACFLWDEHPQSQVVAICERDEARREGLKKRYRCDVAYSDLAEMLRDPNVEAVALFTPAPLHADHAAQVMEAGKHVISAVPAATTLEGCQRLVECVERTGLTYMMAETSYYMQDIISCRQWAREGAFGELFYSEAEYHHHAVSAGSLAVIDGQRTWRYGYPPMHYVTHSTGIILPVIGERFTEVACVGWGNDDEILKTNAYKNPFWCETAFYRTSGGQCARVAIHWWIAHAGAERGQFFGTKMSYEMARPGGVPALISRGEKTEPFEVPKHWATALLPEPLRHETGHGGSHAFLTHEFIDALASGRRPAVDIYEAVAYTAPGIVAHESALKGGETLKIPSFDPRPGTPRPSPSGRG